MKLKYSPHKQEKIIEHVLENSSLTMLSQGSYGIVFRVDPHVKRLDPKLSFHRVNSDNVSEIVNHLVAKVVVVPSGSMTEEEKEEFKKIKRSKFPIFVEENEEMVMKYISISDRDDFLSEVELSQDLHKASAALHHDKRSICPETIAAGPVSIQENPEYEVQYSSLNTEPENNDKSTRLSIIGTLIRKLKRENVHLPPLPTCLRYGFIFMEMVENDRTLGSLVDDDTISMESQEILLAKARLCLIEMYRIPI